MNQPVLHLLDRQSRVAACCGLTEGAILSRKEDFTLSPDEQTCRPRLRDVICPQCRKPFRLAWGEFEKPLTLVIQGCPSGGIYNVYITCPHCDYREEL